MKNKEKIIGSIVIVSILIIFISVGFIKDRPSGIEEEDIFVDKQEQKKEPAQTPAKDIKVEIKGEVKQPGVYSLMSGSRVEDLIYKAGGFTEFADRDSVVSLAKRLKDEDCIVIKKRQELQGQQQTPDTGKSASPEKNADGKININTASKEELDSIPGIGPVTAQKIIDYRDKYGDFSTIEDLKKIDRIGDKTINNIRDKIDVR